MSAASSTKRSRPPVKAEARLRAGRPNSALAGIWIYLALFAITLAVYAPVRQFDFINYDDPEYVTSNPHVQQGISVHGIEWAATSRDAANWFPLTRVSHMLDAQLFGLDAGMHHLVNALLHALAALFVFEFLFRATRRRWAGAFVAFVFALHPFHVESVAWISERKDVLCALFWFVTLWLYTRYAERPEWRRYLLVLFSFCLGLLSKPMIVTLPLVLLLLDVWPLRRARSWKRLILEKIPFAVMAAGAAVITYSAQQASRAVKAFPLGIRFENALVSYATYIVKMFWPANLAVFYPYPRSIPAWQPIVATLALAAISFLVLRTARTRPYLLVGWSWYLITLLPVIGVIQAGAQARADRYTYIPMVGLLVMLAWGAADLALRWCKARAAIVTCAAAACACCVVLTSMQLQYWRNSESLFRHAIEVTQGNYVAEHNLGLAISDQPGRLPEAIAHYQAALRMQPESVEARSDLGSALAKSGRFDQALAEFETALRLAPDCSICRANLAIAQGQEAQELFEEGVALAKAGKTQEAIDRFEAALRLAPDNPELHNNLGVALATLGQIPLAIREFQAAIRLKPDYEDARYNLRAAQSQR
ncbi:MAG: tetratricopeptide repeat protein [Acidobacteriaceae bacterium]|nr:tetratricopeptide repeat protein [Acidobacteriaceae bacterium]